jgi:tetratricopeptide (TPR) repeat protein
MNESSPAKRSLGERIVVCIYLVAITWLVFGQTLRHDFVNYDDDAYVYQKPIITSGITLPGIAWAFTHVHARNWHPLTTISHMLDCQLFQLNAGGHHFTNVLLHSIVVVLLFLILETMTGAIWRSAFVAAVFAIHPLHVESVAWIAERKDVLSGVFFMLTLAAYLHYVRKQTAGRFATVAILFACGLMSKPILVTLPLVLLLLDYWPLHRIVDFRTAGKLVVEKIPLLALSAASCVATVIAQGELTGEMEPFPLTWRINNALVSYLTYFWQMFWPVRLAAFYPHPENRLPLWEIIFALVFLIAMSSWAIVLRRTRPYFIVGWFWYLGMLVPVIGLLQAGMQGHADRYTYLPQVGLYLLVAWAVCDLLKSWRYRRELLGISATIALAALGWKAHAQTPYWRDSESLWKHALAVTADNQAALNNLAVLFEERGQLDSAISYYRQSINVQSSSGHARHSMGLARAHVSLAGVLLRHGQIDDAIAQTEAAIKLQPRLADAYAALGNAFLQKRTMSEAIMHYEKSLAIAPQSIVALNNLALILATCPDARFRDGHRAIELAKQADELSGRNNPSIVRNLAAAYAETGRFKEATETAKRAMKLALAQKNAALVNDARVDIDLYGLNLPRHEH